MADDIQQTDPAQEIPDLPGEGDAPSAPEPVSREEFNRLSQELEDSKRLLNESTRMRQPAAPQSFQVAGVSAEQEQQYRQDPYSRWVAAQLLPEFQRRDEALGRLQDDNDRLNTKDAVDEMYGRGTYKKLATDVEQEYELMRAAGRPVPRDKLVYGVAVRKGVKLTPVTEQAESESRSARRREKSAAVVETGAPARRASEPVAKTLSAMTQDELRTKLQAEIAAGKKY